jgi:hypothetical protein
MHEVLRYKVKIHFTAIGDLVSQITTMAMNAAGKYGIQTSSTMHNVLQNTSSYAGGIEVLH